MTEQLTRRDFGVGVAALVAMATVLEAGPARGGSAQGQGFSKPSPPFEPVEGMRGDRRNNELWYQLETQTRVNPSPELLEAYMGVQTHAEALGGLDTGLLFAWLGYYGADGYPDKYAQWLLPLRDELVLISRVQLAIFDAFYAPTDRRLISAFEDYGQGVLYDPRHGERVHFNASLVAYGVWHAFSTGMALLDVDRRRWQKMIPLIHHARRVQERAMPKALQFNDPLPRRVLHGIRHESLRMTSQEIDVSYFEFDYPFDRDAIPKPPGV